jgi:hypothetical protein
MGLWPHALEIHMSQKPIDLETLSARLAALEALVAELSKSGTHGANDRKTRLRELERWSEQVQHLSPALSYSESFGLAWKAAVQSLMSLVKASLLRD